MEQPKKNPTDIIREQIKYLDTLTNSDTLGLSGSGDLNSWLDAITKIFFLASALPGKERSEIVRKNLVKVSSFSEKMTNLALATSSCNYRIPKLILKASDIIYRFGRQPLSVSAPAAAEYDINEADLEAHEDDPVPKGMDFLIWNDEETGEIVLVMTKDEPLRLSSKEARALARTLFRRSNETMSIPRDDSNAGSLSLLRNRPQEKKQSQELHHSSRLDDTAMLQLLPNHQAACHESQQRIQGLKVSASPEPYNLQQ